MADSNTCNACGESTPLPYFCRRCWQQGSTGAQAAFYREWEHGHERALASFKARIR